MKDTTDQHWFARYRQVILYGIAMAVLIFLLKWVEYRFVVLDYALETYMGILAVFFTALGIWLAIKLSKPKVQTIVVEKPVYVTDTEDFLINQEELDKLNISRRELEVLQLMAEGLSNQEISERLFVSLNTIKTHSQKLFEKMEVKRRTQAVEMAKRLGIIP